MLKCHSKCLESTKILCYIIYKQKGSKWDFVCVCLPTDVVTKYNVCETTSQELPRLWARQKFVFRYCCKTESHVCWQMTAVVFRTWFPQPNTNLKPTLKFITSLFVFYWLIDQSRKSIAWFVIKLFCLMCRDRLYWYLVRLTKVIYRLIIQSRKGKDIHTHFHHRSFE